MRILIVLPSTAGDQCGNAITARRWHRLLGELGHGVEIQTAYGGQACDALIALHARRSAVAIQRFHEQCPRKPLIVAMTGSDLYRDINKSETVRQSLRWASRIVLLQLDGLGLLPKHLAHKVRVIYQSAIAPPRRGRPLIRVFEVCVIGHLRPVKDPLRAALAARHLPDSSRIRVVHMGKALHRSLQRRAVAEMETNARYRWLGELTWRRTQQRLARARLLVVSSAIEGGANIISESLAAGVPLVASRVSGNVGLLGETYPGFFPVGDTRALAALMLRAESDAAFYQSLREHCAGRLPLVQPAREKKDWDELLGEFLWEACGARGSRN